MATHCKSNIVISGVVLSSTIGLQKIFKPVPWGGPARLSCLHPQGPSLNLLTLSLARIVTCLNSLTLLNSCSR